MMELQKMFNWLNFSPRSAQMDDRKNISASDADFMLDLVLTQIENAVIEFENQQDEQKQKEKESKSKSNVDYSWLVSAAPARRKKYLTIEERNKIENACFRLQTNEWSKVLNTWKNRIDSATTRNAIVDIFLTTVHEVILSRPRPPTVTRVLRKYLRSQSSANSVSDSPQPTSRSIGQLSIEELGRIV